MADWRDGLNPVNMTPQGTAQPKANGGPMPESPLLGMGANVANMATTGAGLGAMFGGPVGGAIGGAGGGILGAFLPPSTQPGTDLGATAANVGLNALLPGAGSASKLMRLLRTGGITLGTGLGAYGGSKLDQDMGNSTDTPWGRIMLYTGTSGLAGAMKAVTAPSFNENLVGQAANAVKDATGADIPLTLPQRTGVLNGVAQRVIPGTEQGQELALAQSKAALSATEKIFNRAIGDTNQAVESGAQTQGIAKKTISQWVTRWKSANEVGTPSEVETGVLDASGNPITKTRMDYNLPDNVNWNDFSKEFGLTDLEKDALFRSVKTDPARFVDTIVSDRGLGALKGNLMLRALQKVLPAEDSGTLSTAVVLRSLAKSGAIENTADGQVLSGVKFAQMVSDKSKVLSLALGPDRYKALQDVATVMKATDPSRMANPNVMSQQSHTLSYLANKAAFSIAGIGAGATAGYETHKGNPVMGALEGAAIGGTAVIGFSTVLSKILANPSAATAFMKASHGDATAATSFVRSLYSISDAELNTPTPAKSPLDGLFKSR